MSHFVTETTTLRGYTIPKHTVVKPMLCEVHADPRLFPEPEVFRADRFLDGDGKFLPHPAMVAFGVGKRECPGKTLAKQEAFLFTACLLHQVRH